MAEKTAEQFLTQCRNLIALAGSDFEEEARTSAYFACKLIRERGFHISIQAQTAARPAQAPPPRQETRPARPRRITLKYDSRCLGCGAMVEEGEIAWWLQHAGISCEDCGAEVLR